MSSIVVVLLLLTLSLPASASTVRVPADQPTIADGIAEARSVGADTLLIATGTYLESGLYVPSGLLVRGEGTGGARPVIDAGGADTLFSIEWYTVYGPTTFEDLELRNASEILVDLSLAGEYTVARCDFVGNANTGIGLSAVPYEDMVEITVGGCDFTDLEHGMVIGSVFGTVNGCWFTNNRTTGSGGAVKTDFRSGQLDFSHCEFRNNHADLVGGAVESRYAIQLNFNSCHFEGNSAGLYGGAIFRGEFGQNRVTGCHFIGNTPDALTLGLDGYLVVESCLLVGNGTAIRDNLGSKRSTAPDGWSPGSKDGSLSISVSRCTIVGNTGDGIAHTGGWIGGVKSNNIIAFNGGHGVRTQFFVQNEYNWIGTNCVYGNAAGDWGDAAGGYACIDGNMSRDPRFCDFAGGDYALCTTSPCLPGNHSGDGLIGLYMDDCYVHDPFLDDLGAPLAGEIDDRSYAVALADYDEDGRLDAFFTSATAGGVNRSTLYRNGGEPCFSFEDVGVAAGVVCAGVSRGAAWGDFDDDGDLDLFVATTIGADHLFQNTGAPAWTFLDVAAAAGVDAPATASQIPVWIDYDGDGDLDLYLGANGPNKLYRNEGAASFVDVAVSAGVADPGTARSCAWSDYDGDGDPDLFVSNYDVATPNALYVNQGDGTFVADVASAVAEAFVSNGAAWGDYDGDGHPDLHVAGYDQPDRLYRNQGPPTFGFVEEAASMGVADAGPSRSNAWIDFDRDGDLDLYVGDYDDNRLYRNDGTQFVHDYQPSLVSDHRSTRGMAWGDVDGDGRRDVFLANYLGHDRLLQNHLPIPGHWLEIELRDTDGNRCPGARVRVVTPDGAQVREVPTGGGYYSQQAAVLHFGLDHVAYVDTLEIRWPDGGITRQGVSTVDRRIVLERGVTAVDEVPGAPGLHLAIAPNPANPRTEITFRAERGLTVTLELYDAEGRLVRRLFRGVATGDDQVVAWDGRDRAGRRAGSGSYLCRMNAGGEVRGSKLTLLK